MTFIQNYTVLRQITHTTRNFYFIQLLIDLENNLHLYIDDFIFIYVFIHVCQLAVIKSICPAPDLHQK